MTETNPRQDAMLASVQAYADAVTAGFLPLAAGLELSQHNVPHDVFLAVADRYGVEITLHTQDPAHLWASLKVPLYADPFTFKAELRLYSGTTTALSHLYPMATPEFLAQCEAHNRDCVEFIPAGLADTKEN